MARCLRLGLLLVLFMGLQVVSVNAGQNGKVIVKGSKVTFDYTLTVDGNLLESSEGREPLQYVQGEGTIIPGLARELEGMRAGEEKDVVVLPENGYGNVDVNAVKEIPKSQLNLSPEVNLQPGAQIQATDDQGRKIVMRVKEVKEDTIVFDFNHPLAGKTLNFHVKIATID